jgi:flagellar assembly factor FliW
MTALDTHPQAFPASAAAVAPAGRLSRVVEFVEPIPGFPLERNFAFSAVDASSSLFTFRSLRTDGLRFLVTPPGEFFPGYQPALDDAQVAALELGPDDEVQVLVIITVRDGIADATANLLAPVVLSTKHGRAVQVVLSDEALPLRAPLVGSAS